LSSKDTAVCYYESQVQCWCALKVGRSKAAITAIAWHPSSQFLATGSTDCKCVVYDVNEAAMLPAPQAPFGAAQVTEDAGAWVNDVAFSPNGSVLAFVSQDSSVRFKNLAGGPQAAVDVVRWRGLPFLRATFVGNHSLVACGFDYVPVLFRESKDGKWQALGSLDCGPVAGLPGLPSAAPSTHRRESFDEARSRFKQSGSGTSLATK
ncbi:unnamed protein product, partial [Polarella glacialis]